MTKITKKQATLDLSAFMQLLTEDQLATLGLEKVSKAKLTAKEAFVGQAKLVEALRVHYDLSRADRFEESELANASYKLRGKANLRNLMLTWGHLNKQPSVEKFVGNKDSKKLWKTWWSKHDIK